MRKEKEKGCCKNKLVISIFSTLIILIVLALSGNALSCGFQNPTTASNGVLNSGGIINVSFGNTGGIASTRDAIRVYVNISSSFTANSSTSTTIGFNINSTNGTQNKDSVNISLDTISNVILEDGQSYTLNCYCENRTTSDTVGANSIACNSTRTGIYVDRTIPQSPTGVTPSGELTSAEQTVSATINGANTTGCIVEFKDKNPGNSRYAMVHSVNSCSLAFTGIPAGVYRYAVIADDGLNTTESAESTMTIELRTAARKKAYIASGGAIGGGITPPSSSSKSLSILERGSLANNPQVFNGVENARQTFQKEITTPELKKTGTGVLIGAGIGALGFIVPPLAIITIPVGAIIGGLIGAIV